MYLVWVGQTTNEHLRRVYHGQINPYNIGPFENYHNACCTRLPRSFLPDFSEEVPAEYYIERIQRELYEARKKKRLESIEFNPSECSIDSSGTALTRLTTGNGALDQSMIIRSENNSVNQQSLSQSNNSGSQNSLTLLNAITTNGNTNGNDIGNNSNISHSRAETISGTHSGTISPFNILHMNTSRDSDRSEKEIDGLLRNCGDGMSGTVRSDQYSDVEISHV